MNILVIGDTLISGFGLPAGQIGFVGHFVRQISRAGQAVTVERHPQPTLAHSHALLAQLPLERYDLIIWQSGPDALSRLSAPDQQPVRGWQRVWAVVHRRLSRSDTPANRQAILALLRPQRHKVLIMSPIVPPHEASWGREQRYQAFLREGYQQGFSMFDTSLHIRPASEYFLDRHPNYLNAVSHELLGRALFDFYQAAPTVVAIRGVRKS